MNPFICSPSSLSSLCVARIPSTAAGRTLTLTVAVRQQLISLTAPQATTTIPTLLVAAGRADMLCHCTSCASLAWPGAWVERKARVAQLICTDAILSKHQAVSQ